MALTLDLHPYQEEAVDRILARGSMLLAFWMGLGKTVTSLAVAEELLGEGKINQVLLVVPSGLKLQWAASIAKHTDVATQTITYKGETLIVPEHRYCVVVDGTPKRRREQYAMIEELQPDYVIAGYKIVTQELRRFRRMRPGLIIADEVTTIKNPAAAVTKAMRRLDAPYKIGLTGTPVDNLIEELFHVMGWVDPSVFGDPDDSRAAQLYDLAYIDRDHWGSVKGYRNLPTLHKKLAPAVVRKLPTDPDVAPYIPRLEMSRWTVRMDAATQRVYRRMAADLARELEQLPARSGWDVVSHYSGTDESTPPGRVAAIYLCMQMLLDDPELLRSSQSRYAQSLAESGLLDDLGESAKLRRLEEGLSRILEWPGRAPSERGASKAPAAKVIVVSRFKRLVEHLAQRWPGSVVYHGEMSPADKQAAVNRFESDPQVRLLIMSHAGAYGVDVPAASHLINIDPARSAGQRAQLNHRHVRAGSSHRTVQVIDLVTAGTIEERDYERLTLRGRVGSAAIDGVGADEGGRVDAALRSLTSHVNEVLGISVV